MLKKFIKDTEGRADLPVEITDLADAITAKGLADVDIVYLKSVEANPSEIHGAFWCYRQSLGVYRKYQTVAVIPYNANDPIEWQRVTCAKELMHLFDTELEQTNQDNEVCDLINRLLNRFSSDDVGLADLMAGKDKLALYMCLPLLLPRAALLEAREAVENEQLTVKDVAEKAVMPVDLVKLMLDPEWDTLSRRLAQM